MVRTDLSHLPCEVHQMLTDHVQTIRQIPGVTRIILFGSYAKKTARPDSDIDLAVFYDTDSRILLQEYRDLMRICRNPSVEFQVQAFPENELADPCGIIEEIVQFGMELWSAGGEE